MAQPGRQLIADPKYCLDDLALVSPGAVLELDEDANILFVSRSAERLFGYGPRELIDQSISVLVPDVFSAPKSELSGLELEAVRKDGWYFPIEINLTRLESALGTRFIAVIRDITDRKQIEDELRAAQTKSRELEQQSREAAAFLGAVRHELRSPLCTVVGFAELLTEESEGPLTEKQKHFIDYIHKEALHLLELMNSSGGAE